MFYLVTYVRCRTSRTGAPPAPAMTFPARASTWISVKLRSAAKQALEVRMWQSTPSPAQMRNSQLHEKWLLLN